MKVSVPSAPVPDQPVPAVESPIPEPGEVVAPVSAAMAKWPDWFKPVDIAAAILVTIFAFLLASYTARNSDIWRHLGTGRLIAQGHHPIGGDPLSFTGAERGWVNSNWIFDLLMYVAYSADDSGVTAVVLKALVFAAGFGLLFLLRKPEQSLWPWAVVAAIGALATGSAAALDPTVFGTLFVSIVLALIFRGNWAGPKWRMPAILGGVCWVWACTDSFYLLGPLLILLVFLGEDLHRKFKVGAPDTTPGDDPFWAAPPSDALKRALIASVAGALLNPMFLGALIRSPLSALGQLIPFELTFGWGDTFAGDALLTNISLSPITEPYYGAPDLGASVPGGAALLLLLGTGVLVGFGYARVRVTHILLWSVFAVLAALHYRFIPAAVAVSIPLAAANLNGLSRFRLQSVLDPTTKALLNLSGIGRILTAAALVLAIAATVPGYLHARVSIHPEYNRRVSWGIDSDVGLARSAKAIQEWKSEGKMPDESYGLLSHYDFGDYCAWYAPREKVFLDSRFRFHARELEDLIAIRRELQVKAELADTAATATNGKLLALTDKYKTDYVVLGRAYTQLDAENIKKIEVELNDAKSNFAWLNMDGRVAIGTRTDTETGKTNAANLVFVPGKGAFGPNPPPVPSAKSVPPLKPVEGWVADFVGAPPLPGSVETDDAQLFLDLANHFGNQSQKGYAKQFQLARAFPIVGGIPLSLTLDPGKRLPNEVELSFPILANRAARRAIAETPDDPRPYHVLAKAVTLRYTGSLNPKDAELQRMTSLHRFLDRVPVTPNGEARFFKEVVDDELILFLLHYDAGHIDLASDALARANAKIKVAPDGDGPTPARMKNIGDVYRQKSLEQQFGLQPKTLDGIMGISDAGIAEAISYFSFQRDVGNGAPPPTQDAIKRDLGKKLTEVAATNLTASDKADKPRDGAWVKAHCQTLEDRMKRDLGKRNEFYTQEAAKIPGIANKFTAAVRAGLIGRAIELVSGTSEWASIPASDMTIVITGQGQVEFLADRFPSLLKTATPIFDPNTRSLRSFGVSDLGMNLQMIEFQLVTGQLDMAALNLTSVETRVDALDKDHPNDAQLGPARAVIKQLRSLQARLEGNFDKMAEDAREQIQRMPQYSPAYLAELKKPFEFLQAPLAAVAGVNLVQIDAFGNARRSLLIESALYYELGLTALQAGDTKEARMRFAMALKPQGLPIGFLDGNQELMQYASMYSSLLNKYSGEKQPR